MSWYSWQAGSLLLSCYLQPRAARDEIVGLHADSVKIRITAPPVEGQANAHLQKFLARQFGVAKSNVSIISGELGRQKRVKIDQPTKLPPQLDIERP